MLGFFIGLGIIASVLILGITVAFALLIVYVLQHNNEGKIDSSTTIATIITSSATYAPSLIGTLAIVVKYMFNKNDISDHTNLLKSFLDSDVAKEQPPMQEKSVNKLADQSGLTAALQDSSDKSNDRDSGQKK